MPYNTSDINGYIAKAQRALADYVLKGVKLESYGEDCDKWYLKSRYLSAATRVLNSNHGLTDDQIESVIHCMIECGEINTYSSSVFSFPTITIVDPICCPQKITDLIDGPGGSLSGKKCRVVTVKCDETGWDFNKIGFQGTVLFVSPDGDDDCAEKGNIMCHYRTIAGAQAAAVSGDTIVIMPGIYNESGLGKDGITYHYLGGTYHNVTASAHTYLATTAINFKVTGHGSFRHDNADGFNIFYVSAVGSSIYAEGIDFDVTLLSRVAGANGAGKYTIKGRRATSTATSQAFDVRGTDCEAIIDFTDDILQNSNNRAIMIKNASGCYVSVKARKIYSEETGAGIEFGTITIENSGTSDVVIRASTIINNAGGNGIGLGVANATAVASLYVYSNIETTTGRCFNTSVASSSASIVYIYGRLCSTGSNALRSNVANITINVDGELISDGAPVVSQSLGTIHMRGRIICNWNNAGGHGVLKTDGIFVFEDVTIKLANASAYAVHSGSAGKFAHVYDARTNVLGDSANITYRVNNILHDANVV